VLAAGLLVQRAEDVFEARDLPFGLDQVRFERGPEVGRARRFRHLLQRLDQLLLSIVSVAQFIYECIVQRTGFGHRYSLL
jgi:hypothetical protein